MITFNYGTVNSSKTMNLLALVHNYEAKNIKVYLVKQATDTREDDIKSRVGLHHKADFIYDTSNSANKASLAGLIRKAVDEDAVVVFDECQFMDYEDVKLIEEVMYDEICGNALKVHDFAILGYGLLTDFSGKLFDGTRGWLEISKKLNEIKNLCSCCQSKATKNYLKKNNRPSEGNTAIGDTEYIPVCARHYYLLENHINIYPV